MLKTNYCYRLLCCFYLMLTFVTSSLALDLSGIVQNATMNMSCSNGEINVSILEGSQPFDVTWEKDGLFYSSIFGITGMNDGEDLTNLGQGTYKVTVNDILGGVATLEFVVSCDGCPNLLYGIKHHDFIECEGELGMLTAILSGNGTPPMEILWSNGETTAHIENLEPNYYTVTVSDNNNCSEEFGLDLYVVNQTPVLFEDEDLETDHVCASNPLSLGSISFINPYGPGYKYSWVGPNGYISNSMDISGLSLGEYCVTVKEVGNTCLVAKGCVTIQPTDGAEVNIVNIENVPLCKEGNTTGKGSITISVSGGSTINWLSIPNQNEVNSTSITGLDPGSYTVQVELDGCVTEHTFEIICCKTIINGDEVTSVPTIGFTGTPSGSTTATSNDGSIAGSLSGNNGLPIYISWTGPNGFTSNETSLENLSIGSYCYVITDGCTRLEGCIPIVDCSAEEPIVITEDLSHTCEDQSCGFISLTTTGGSGDGFKYNWSNSNSTSNERNNLPEGTYTVTITDLGQCNTTATKSFTINETEEIIPVFDKKETSICEIRLYCKHPDSDKSCHVNTGYGTPVEYYDPNDCRIKISECIDRGEYLEMGPEHVFARTEKKTSTTETNIDECYSFEKCENGDEYDEPNTRIDGELTTEQQEGTQVNTEGQITCFYCLEREICKIGDQKNKVSEIDFAKQINVACMDKGCDTKNVTLYCDWNSDNIAQDDEIIEIFTDQLSALNIAHCDPNSVDLPLRSEQEIEYRNSNNLKKLTIYPNPAINELFIDIPNGSAISYTILTSTGEHITSSSSSTNRINIEFLNSGFYILQLKTNTINEVHQFIKF